MKLVLILLAVAILASLLYSGVRFYLTVQVSKKIIDSTVPYTFEGDASNAVLVLGDSTAYGIGARTPEESLAGRVAKHLGASSVENYSRSGARTSELTEQLARAEHDRYRLILIQTGGNDIIRFQSAKKAAEELSQALELLPESDQVVVITAGDVGGATLFPLPLRPFYTRLNTAYHAAFEETVTAQGMTYVNFGKSPSTEAINARPDIYLAKDGLHPSSAGYALWFDEIRPRLK